MENKPDKPDTIYTPSELTTTKGVQYWIDKWNADPNARNTEDAEHEIVEPKSINSGGFIPNENGGMDYIEPKQLPPIDNEK